MGMADLQMFTCTMNKCELSGSVVNHRKDFEAEVSLVVSQRIKEVIRFFETYLGSFYIS